MQLSPFMAADGAPENSPRLSVTFERPGRQSFPVDVAAGCDVVLRWGDAWVRLNLGEQPAISVGIGDDLSEFSVWSLQETEQDHRWVLGTPMRAVDTSHAGLTTHTACPLRIQQVVTSYVDAVHQANWTRQAELWALRPDIGIVAQCLHQPDQYVCEVYGGQDVYAAKLNWSVAPSDARSVTITDAWACGRVAWVGVRPADGWFAFVELVDVDLFNIETKEATPDWRLRAIYAFERPRPPISEQSLAVRSELDAGVGATKGDLTSTQSRAPSPELSRALALPRSFTRTTFNMEIMAFLASIGVFVLTRFWSLDLFPIYFHGDEAFQIVAAKRLIANGFRNELGVPFPLYFTNGGAWAPLIPVYLHVITSSLLGVSVIVSRGTAAMVATLGAIAIAFFVRDGLKLRFWWLTPLLIAMVPAWFLHSRTTFETVYCVSGYSVFLWMYARYRTVSPSWGVGATVAGAFTFYTYTNGQLIVGVTVLLLLLSDASYHLRQRFALIPVILTATACLVPYVLYARTVPSATADQLWRVSSYLVRDISLTEKVWLFLTHYLSGLSPIYWFTSTSQELSRHVMLGYAYIPVIFAPFIVVGFGVIVRQWRNSAYRVVLVAILATPIGAGLADIGITRVLTVVVPATITAVIGLHQSCQWAFALSRRVTSSTKIVAKTVDVDAYRKWISAGAQSVLWLAFALPCLLMLRDSLVAGPTWYTDYGLYGQQWGATQVFSKIVLRSTTSPNDTYYISSTWANGTDIYLPYFVPALADTGRVRMGNVRDLFTRKQQLTTDMVWVVTSDDVVAVRSSGRFKTILVDDLISYPNGEAGFSFLRLQYIDNLEELIARDRELRLALRTGRVIVGGQTLQVRHTALDAGGLGDIFDGNARTLGRFNGGNPAVLEFAFASPVPISNLSLAMTAGNWSVLARLVSTGGAQIEVNRVIDARTDPIVSLDIEPMTVASARIELRLQTAGDEAIVHLRDVTWS